MFGPVIKGTKVTLRPPIAGDAARFVEWFADTEVRRYRAGRVPQSVQEEEEFLKRIGDSKDDVWWAIEAEGRTIGTTDIHEIDWVSKHAITGTVIGDKAAWHKGYGSEAMALRTAHAFRELGLHKLKSGALMDNEASKRALQKAGYRHVGTQREEYFLDGRWQDHWLYEVLREDWETQHPEKEK